MARGEHYCPPLCIFHFHMSWREGRNWALQPGPRVSISTLTIFQIYHHLGIIWEQRGLPNFTELFFPLRSTELLFLAWFSSFCLEVLRAWGTASAAGPSSSLPSVLPPWMPKAEESLWQHLEQENEVIMGCCSEKVGSCCWGSSLRHHPFLVLVGWETESPTSKRLF